MKSPPCRECEKRQLRCHSTCESYKIWSNEIQRTRVNRENGHEISDYKYKVFFKKLYNNR